MQNNRKKTHHKMETEKNEKKTQYQTRTKNCYADTLFQGIRIYVSRTREYIRYHLQYEKSCSSIQKGWGCMHNALVKPSYLLGKDEIICHEENSVSRREELLNYSKKGKK